MEFLNESDDQYMRRAAMGSRAAAILLDLYQFTYDSSEDDLKELADTIYHTLPAHSSLWDPHHHQLAAILTNPEKLWYYDQHIKRETDMLNQLRQESAIVLPSEI